MTVVTDHGAFGSFKDLETYMRLEKVDAVRIETVSMCAGQISLPFSRKVEYTHKDILSILDHK